MAKKRKLKKSVLIGIYLIGFFLVYGVAFYGFSIVDNKDKAKTEVKADIKEDTRELMTQLKSKNKIPMITHRDFCYLDGVIHTGSGCCIGSYIFVGHCNM